MAFVLDKCGTISTFCGDTGRITISGIPTDKNYYIYFALRDRQRNFIFEEYKESLMNTSVTFDFDAEFTNTLEVPESLKYETFYYGVKVCDASTLTEDTATVQNQCYGKLNEFRVYPMAAEGLENE